MAGAHAWSIMIPALSIVGYTDRGQRDNNEDAMTWDSEVGAVALADGMGGHEAGEVASAMAAGLFTNGFRCWLEDVGAYLVQQLPATQERLIRTWLGMQAQSIHDSILDAAAMVPGCMGMGTTFCGVIAWGECAWVIHIGDSRVYSFDRENKQLRCLTRDHSVVQRHVDEGRMTAEAARYSLERHVLTQALGVGESVLPDITVEPFANTMVLGLCTDGLSDMVTEPMMVRALRDHPPALAGRLLLSQASNLGGQDNISIVLISKE